MDTTQLTGSQAGTITVNFDRPFQAAVQLNVQGIVHGDITLSPAIIQIGRISRGTVATASFKMRHLANTNWKIVGMTSGNDHLQADLIEARGADGEQAIRMRIKVQSDTPEGMLITHLVLQSDEKATNCLRVPLVVEVGR